MNSLEPLPEPPPLPIEPQVGWILGSALFFCLIGDRFLWAVEAGISFGLFVLGLLLVLWMHRRVSFQSRPSQAAGILLGASLVQSAIERSLSNNLVVAALVLFLVGEGTYPELGQRWARFAQALRALLTAPWHLGWLPHSLLHLPPPSPERRAGICLLLRASLPALVLGFGFACILAMGNAVLGRALLESMEWTCRALFSFELSPGRVCFWSVSLVAALGLLRPRPQTGDELWWARPIPLLVPEDMVLARWRTLAILVVLNGLFFAANTVDAAYLWLNGRLPEGVSKSQFVHHGVYSLILAVLLSALVLMGLFQQSGPAVASRWVRRLSLAWVLQNVVLILSVLLRLKMYVDEFQWSELRVYVGFFLLLVSSGFALLAWRIVAGKRLEWLIGANACAVFVLFFVLQFLNVAGWVAGTNVAVWSKDPRRTLDLEYLAQLGAPAYRALGVAASSFERAEAPEARLILERIRREETSRRLECDWRSYQVRREQNVRWLLGEGPEML